MGRTVGEQVQNGLRLAGGVILFCASLFLLAYGLDVVFSGSQFVWSAWIGWLELFLAVVLIPLTMHLWIQFFAGCLLFGFLKTIVVTVVGRDWFPPHLPFSRLEAAEMAFFFGATLIWLFRFAKARPAFPDRIAMTLYLFFFLLASRPHFSFLEAGAGLLMLFLAWCISRWRRAKPKSIHVGNHRDLLSRN